MLIQAVHVAAGMSHDTLYGHNGKQKGLSPGAFRKASTSDGVLNCGMRVSSLVLTSTVRDNVGSICTSNITDHSSSCNSPNAELESLLCRKSLCFWLIGLHDIILVHTGLDHHHSVMSSC